MSDLILISHHLLTILVLLRHISPDDQESMTSRYILDNTQSEHELNDGNGFLTIIVSRLVIGLLEQ